MSSLNVPLDFIELLHQYLQEEVDVRESLLDDSDLAKIYDRFYSEIYSKIYIDD